MRSTFLLAVVLLGCGGGEAPPPPPAPPPQTAPATPTADAPPAPRRDPATPRARTETLEGSIAVSVLDVQLFHPNTARRLMADPRIPTDRTAEQGSGFGVGLLLEARNDSQYILGNPRILSDVTVHGTHGAAGCRVVPRRRSFWSRTTSSMTILSPQRSERTPWADDARDAYELVWRPAETLRIRAVLECGPIHLHDIHPTGLSGTFQVAATAPFAEHEVTCDNDYEVCGDDVAGRSAELTLPARVFSLALVQLPGGASGYLAGDIFVHGDQGRVFHDSIANHMSSAFTATTADLPPTPAPVRDVLDEWSLNIDSVTLQHWTDVPTAPRGSRLVTVNARVAIDSGAIEGRLRGAVDVARQEDAVAQQALANAQAASAAAPDDPSATAALRAAEAQARATSSAIGRAQSTYDRSIGSERTRLARLLACDRVQLVTHARLQRVINGREMAAACSVLAAGSDSATVSWIFLVSRYEIPVGLTYTVGRDPHTAFFAAQSLATFDPR